MTKVKCQECGYGQCKYATKKRHMGQRTAARVVTAKNCVVPKEEVG